MSGKHERAGETLDLQHPLIRQVAEMIGLATGERLLIVSPESSGWEQIYIDAQLPQSLPFCKLIQSSAEGAKHCHMCHILMTVAACSGGPAEQRCHAGASLLSCPVAVASGEAMAVFSSCMFTSVDAWTDVRQTGERLGIDIAQLRKAFRSLPQPDERHLQLVRSALRTMSLAIQMTRQNKELGARVRKSHAGRESRSELERYLGETTWPKTAHSRPDGAGGEKPLLVHVVCELVRQRPDLPLSVKEIAAAARLTPNHFTTLFREHAGCPFTEFLTEERIARAKKLLQNPTLSINEIAQLVGYDDPGYFTRRFREKTRLSPRTWRNRQFGPDAPA
jgi:AraC-like DNA-binding protein/ligand-binding sensor protein